MRFSTFLLAFVLALVAFAFPALAGCPAALQGGSCSANLQANYAAPVQQLAVQAYVAPAQVRVVQRVVQPQAVYVQPQAVVQQQIVAPYVQQQLAVQSYGTAANLQLNLGANRQRLNLGGAQRVVTSTRTVTRTSGGGLVGRLLGR